MTNTDSKNILVTGSTGLIGSALCETLLECGYNVYALNRNRPGTPFNYSEESNAISLDPNILLHAVVNLAGPNLSDKRWTRKRKKYLLDSRVRLTNALATGLSQLPFKPKVLISASAIGYYGLTGENFVDEESPCGNDFLADIGRQWEQATSPAEQAGINTIHLRTGVVLSKKGGMLQKLLLPFKLGLGGRVGNGKQYLSWISISDVLEVIHFLIRKNPKSGPINLVSDEPVTNAEFTKQLGRALHRPILLPMPKFIVKLLFGEMGDTLLLGSVRVKSKKLELLGSKLNHRTIDSALQAILNAN